MEIESGDLAQGRRKLSDFSISLQDCLQAKYSFLVIFERSLQTLIKLLNRSHAESPSLNIDSYLQKIVDLSDDPTGQFTKNDFAMLSYDRSILEAFGLLLADSQLSKVQSVEKIADLIHQYIKHLLRLSMERNTPDLFKDLTALKYTLDRSRNSQKYSQLHQTLSRLSQFSEIAGLFSQLIHFHNCLYLGHVVSDFDFIRCLNRLNSLLVSNSHACDFVYGLFAKRMVQLFCQLISVHIPSYSEIVNFTNQFIAEKIKNFDDEFIQASFDLRFFLIQENSAIIRKHITMYSGSLSLFGQRVEEPTPLRQILDLPTFSDIKNSIVFDEFKKNATYLSNQEFSLSLATYNENTEQYSNFKAKVLETSSEFYSINFELYRILKSNEIEANTFDHNACLKLFNFLAGFGYMSYFYGLSQILRHKNQSMILTNLSTIITRILQIFVKKARVFSKVAREEMLDTRNTNVYFFESLFKLYVISFKFDGSVLSPMMTIHDQIEEIFQLMANNLDVEAFAWAFFRGILFLPNSHQLFGLLHKILRGQLTKTNPELCELVFKKYKPSEHAEILSFNYENNARNGAVLFDLLQDKSIWDFMVDVLSALEHNQLSLFIKNVEVLIDFNQFAHLKIIYDSMNGKILSLVETLETMKSEEEKQHRLVPTLKLLLKFLSCVESFLLFANFKSYALSKKMTDVFIRIYKGMDSILPSDDFEYNLRTNIKLTNLQILQTLGDTSIGLRSYMDQENNEKAILEDTPIESHIKRIFELIEQESFSLDISTISEIELQMHVKFIEVFNEFVDNKMSKNLLLQLIDSKGSRLFSKENQQSLSSLASNQFKLELCVLYLSALVKTLLQFLKIKSGAEAKCILAVLGLPVSVEGNDKESEAETHCASINAVIDEIKLFSNQLIKLNPRLGPGHGDFITKGLEMISKEVNKNKKRFRGLEKKVKLEFKDIMPDELEQRMTLASTYSSGFEIRKAEFSQALQKLDFPRLFHLIIDTGERHPSFKSFKMPPRPRIQIAKLPLTQQIISTTIRQKTSLLNNFKNKIKSFFPLFKDLEISKSTGADSAMATKIAVVSVYKPEVKQQHGIRGDTNQMTGTGGSYLVFNAKKAKDDEEQTDSHHHKLYRTSHGAHPTGHRVMETQAQTRHQYHRSGQADYSRPNVHSGAVQKMIKTATGGSERIPQMNVSQLEGADLNNPMAKLINSLPFKPNLMGFPPSGISQVQQNVQGASERQQFDGRGQQGIGHGQKPYTESQSQFQTGSQMNPPLLNALSGQSNINAMGRMPMYLPYGMQMPQMAPQMQKDQAPEDMTLGKRPMMNLPPMQMQPGNPMFPMNMQSMPGQQMMTPAMQLQMMNQMFMLQNQQMRPGQLPHDSQNQLKDLSSNDALNPAEKSKLGMQNLQSMAQIPGIMPGMMFPPGMMPGMMPSFPMYQPQQTDLQQEIPNQPQPEGSLQKLPQFMPPGMPISSNMPFAMQQQPQMMGQTQKLGMMPGMQQIFESPYSPHTQGYHPLTPPRPYARSPHHAPNQSPYSNPVGRTMDDSYEFSDNQFSDEEGPREPKVNLKSPPRSEVKHIPAETNGQTNQSELETKSFLKQLSKTQGARFVTKQP